MDAVAATIASVGVAVGIENVFSSSRASQTILNKDNGS